MMEHPPVDFEAISEPIESRIATGLGKVAIALRSQAWKAAGADGLTPTQGQALALLRDETGGVRLAALAQALAVSGPTASDALGSLVAKGLVERRAEAGDRRAAAFRLTVAGADAAVRASSWPDFLAVAVHSLDPAERTALFRALIKVIRALQEAGAISVQRMCVSCRYFQPNVRPDDADRPHVCALVGAPFGDRHLRLDCREQEAASDSEREILWQRFAGHAHQEGPVR